MAAPLAPTGLIIHSDSLTIFLTSLVFVDTVKIGNDFRHKLCLRNFYLPGNPLGLNALTVFHFLETQFWAYFQEVKFISILTKNRILGIKFLSRISFIVQTWTHFQGD